MEPGQRVDTQRAYESLREQIVTLRLAPGSPINEQRLAADLNLALSAVQEALHLLEHEHLVCSTPRHGSYVAEVNIPDLEQISELRLQLEGLAAALAAQRATADDLIVLDAIRQEQSATAVQATTGSTDPRRLFEIDHKFHQAVAEAAHNKYLAEELHRFFGLSTRFWFMLLPPAGGGAEPLASLPRAVEKHLDLVAAIRGRDPVAAERIMRVHVAGFYEAVRGVLASQDAGPRGS
jgi:DNA-binding GntR family transcriptional regulator